MKRRLMADSVSTVSVSQISRRIPSDQDPKVLGHPTLRSSAAESAFTDRGEWSSPGEPIHPGERKGGTGRIGRHRGGLPSESGLALESVSGGNAPKSMFDHLGPLIIRSLRG